MNKMHLEHEKKVKEARGWISPDGKAKYKEYIFERERKKKSIFMTHIGIAFFPVFNFPWETGKIK